MCADLSKCFRTAYLMESGPGAVLFVLRSRVQTSRGVNGGDNGSWFSFGIGGSSGSPLGRPSMWWFLLPKTSLKWSNSISLLIVQKGDAWLEICLIARTRFFRYNF